MMTQEEKDNLSDLLLSKNEEQYLLGIEIGKNEFPILSLLEEDRNREIEFVYLKYNQPIVLYYYWHNKKACWKFFEKRKYDNYDFRQIKMTGEYKSQTSRNSTKTSKWYSVMNYLRTFFPKIDKHMDDLTLPF